MIGAQACYDRKDRQDFRKFKALIASPAALGSGLTLPANAQIYIASAVLLAAPTVLVDANGRHLGAPAAAAGAQWHIGKLSRGVVITKSVSAPGVVRIYVRNGLGHRYLIAQG